MTALLGLLAIAGYQNRDKLFKMLGDLGNAGRRRARRYRRFARSVAQELLARPVQVAS